MTRKVSKSTLRIEVRSVVVVLTALLATFSAKPGIWLEMEETMFCASFWLKPKWRSVPTAFVLSELRLLPERAVVNSDETSLTSSSMEGRASTMAPDTTIRSAR